MTFLVRQLDDCFMIDKVYNQNIRRRAFHWGSEYMKVYCITDTGI